MHAQLEILSGSHTGDVIHLTKRQFLIGRAPDCDCVLDDVTVSRHHCLLTIDQRGAAVCDLDSRNGTRVNHNRIGPSEIFLANGDTLGVGFWIARILLDDAIPQPKQQPAKSGVTTKFFVRDLTQVDEPMPNLVELQQ